MEFSFKGWLKKKPSNPTIYYLKQSEVAIYVTVMFLVFLISYTWLDSPNKVITADENILLVVISLDIISKIVSEQLDKLIFGFYDFAFMSLKSSFAFLKSVFFWLLPIFALLSIGLGFVAGVMGRNKKVLLIFAVYLVLILASFLFFSIYAYFVFVILGIVIHRLIAMKDYKFLRNGEKV